MAEERKGHQTKEGRKGFAMGKSKSQAWKVAEAACQVGRGAGAAWHYQSIQREVD